MEGLFTLLFFTGLFTSIVVSLRENEDELSKKRNLVVLAISTTVTFLAWVAMMVTLFL